jgi:hypothetical protein
MWQEETDRKNGRHPECHSEEFTQLQAVFGTYNPPSPTIAKRRTSLWFAKIDPHVPVYAVVMPFANNDQWTV